MSEPSNTITLKEFKMWLQGVEEMQDSAWVPNPTQWQRIREKINTIEEVTQPAVQQGPVQQYSPIPGHAIQHVQADVYSGQAMVPQSTIPSGPPSPPPHSLFGAPDNIAMPARTPNIDTTNGQYSSHFV